MRIISKIQHFADRIYIEYMRHKVLRSKLEALTDPTFLDRALAKEKKV